MKTAKLPPKAQEMLLPPEKEYYIPELRCSVLARSQEEADTKKDKLIERRTQYTGGNVPRKIKDYGLYYEKE